MGATPSLEAAMETLDDEQLVAIVEQAYRQDADRTDRILTLAKMRHLQHSDAAVTANADATSSSAASVVDSSAKTSPATGEPVVPPPPLVPALVVGSNTTAASTVSASTVDRMAALWTFPGHTLRELRSGATPKKRSADSAAGDVGPVDADGYPVLFGSCGREKKYARCSVCYFRGVRCNTAHYCACCQRPVCVRPRSYPGDEHPKICWNVLHVDADMIQRVDKRRARKLHAVSAPTPKADGSDDDHAPLAAKTSASRDDQADSTTGGAKHRKTLPASVSNAASPAINVTSAPSKPVGTVI